MLTVIVPRWQAPENVKAFTTTLDGGVSQGNYATFNLGLHVGDDIANVMENRRRLQYFIGDSVNLRWLQQTHSDRIVDDTNYHPDIMADGVVSEQINQACVVMTADCLPVLLCNKQGERVTALHCGWRGLYQNVIGKAIKQYFDGERGNILAWLGPAIGAQSYEVDNTLFQRFQALDKNYAKAFAVSRAGHYYFDLYAIARQQLQQYGVAAAAISGGGWDTYQDRRFFSYRQNADTGRMATVIVKIR